MRQSFDRAEARGHPPSPRGVLPKSDRSADSHVRALRTHLKTSKTSAKWITRTQQSALRAFGQHAPRLRRGKGKALSWLLNSGFWIQPLCFLTRYGTLDSDRIMGAV